MRERAWRFCRARSSAREPPWASNRGHRPVAAENRLMSEVTTPSMLSARWCAPTSPASAAARALVAGEDWLEPM